MQQNPDRDAAGGGRGSTGPQRFSAELMHAAASLYYLQDATQAEIAERLGTSRPTVSRLLSEARRLGIVRIEVVAPAAAAETDLAERTARALDLTAVHLSPFPAGEPVGASLSSALSTALLSVGLAPGDVLLVSSGRTVYEAAQAELPQFPGVLVVPTVGGQLEREPWYQTNEIARQVAQRVAGIPTFLYAPALPGADLYQLLLDEPSIRRVLELWQHARCAILGVGAPPLLRRSIASFVPTDAVSLRSAVGDVCNRFYALDGTPVPFPGLERLVATSQAVLRQLPACIALAVGAAKVPSIIGGARGGYFNQLVTDPPTAAALLAALASPGGGHTGGAGVQEVLSS
jgi:DNA-binding transcriptional regulator LsrR (DeoR family)